MNSRHYAVSQESDLNWTATRARLDPAQLEREAGVIDVPEPSSANPAEQAAADTES